MKFVKKVSLKWVSLLVMIVCSMNVKAVDEKFTIYQNCKLEHNKGNDGDSFHVKLPNGKEQVFRLYGVDCLETSDNEDYMKNRLDTQAYYFGIYNKFDLKRRYKNLMQMGDDATQLTNRLIGKGQKFTVMTKHRDAMGKKSRYYAYVFVGDKDLGKELVRAGLARVYGFVDDLPEVDEDSYWRELEDAEMIALGNKEGAWNRTDWREFAKERAAYRKRTGKININNVKKGDMLTLALIVERSGVKESSVKALIDERPKEGYKNKKSLEKVKGIGPATSKDLSKVLKYK